MLTISHLLLCVRLWVSFPPTSHFFSKNVIVESIMREGQYRSFLHHLRAVCVELAPELSSADFTMLTIALCSYLYPRRSSR
jgi:hypothetical protein